MKEIKKTAFFISGGGTTAKAAIEAWGNNKIPGLQPTLVISSDPHAKGIQKVKIYNQEHNTEIATKVLRPKDFNTPELFGDAMLQLLHEYEIDLIAQLGWIKKTPENVVMKFKGRAFNQHPAPLDPGRPDFGSGDMPGMYGLAPHLAVLAFAWMTGIPLQTEATTHFVTEEYDKGDIIQHIPMNIPKPEQDRIIAYEEFNNPRIKKELIEKAIETQEKLLPLEHRNVINTLQNFAANTVPVFRREQKLIPHVHVNTLLLAKKLAITLMKEQK